VGDDAPADPAFHRGSPVVAAAVELVAPFQAADTAFNPRTPVMPTPEPLWLLVHQPFARFGSGLGQHHLFDAVSCGIPLVRGRVDSAVSREQAGRTLKDTQMMGQTGRQLGVLGRTAAQDGIPTDNPALHFVQSDHTTKFRGLAGFACANNRSVGLEQAHHFLRRWHGFSLSTRTQFFA
jgi:hypothetical protein